MGLTDSHWRKLYKMRSSSYSPSRTARTQNKILIAHVDQTVNGIAARRQPERLNAEA